MSKETVLKIENVSFSYDSGIKILDNVSLSIEDHSFNCIVGPNGGGKSTLLMLILGLLKPDQGSITLFGRSPESGRRKVGYMPQHMELDRAFPVTVLDVVLMGCLNKHTFWNFYDAADRDTAFHALEKLRISHLAKKSFAELSGGQRQRVLAARALCCEPQLLLLDEPTANVDPGMQQQFYAELDDLAGEMAVILVSHDLGFVSERIEKVICVNRELHIHPVSKLNGSMIRDIYHSDVNMIRHDHCCIKEHHHHD